MKKRAIALMLLGMMLFATGALAVIIAGGDGTGQTDGTGVVGWNYVGRIQAANNAPSSITYVGDNWFITGYHVKQIDNPTGVLFNSSSYKIDQASWTRLTNGNDNADLVLFRVTGAVSDVPNPVIASNTPSSGAAVTMIGNGRNRATDVTYWTIQWNETTNPNQAAYKGYKYAAGATKRWGTNSVADTLSGVDSGYGITETFYTTFADQTGQAQGAIFDSGGGVFTGTTNDWQLAGMMVTLGSYSGQPGETAVFGNRTYVADLSVYRDQIVQVIPEPHAVALLGLAGAVLGWRHRSRRKAVRS